MYLININTINQNSILLHPPYCNRLNWLQKKLCRETTLASAVPNDWFYSQLLHHNYVLSPALWKFSTALQKFPPGSSYSARGVSRPPPSTTSADWECQPHCRIIFSSYGCCLIVRLQCCSRLGAGFGCALSPPCTASPFLSRRIRDLIKAGG